MLLYRYVYDVSHATMQEQLLSRMREEVSNVLHFYCNDLPEQGVQSDTKCKCPEDVEVESQDAFEDFDKVP